MARELIPISRAIDELEENMSHIARVYEWASWMGFDSPRKFARVFLRHYGVRPQPIIDYIRLKSITAHLRNGHAYSHFKIARAHSLPDEKALNNFTNYHLGCSPTALKKLTDRQLKNLMEEFSSKFKE